MKMCEMRMANLSFRGSDTLKLKIYHKKSKRKKANKKSKRKFHCDYNLVIHKLYITPFPSFYSCHSHPFHMQSHLMVIHLDPQLSVLLVLYTPISFSIQLYLLQSIYIHSHNTYNIFYNIFLQH